MAVVDMLSAMVESAVRAVGEGSGIDVQVGQVVSVPVSDALGAPGMMINRIDVSGGSGGGSLLTIVPASGLVTAEVALDAVRLTDALTTGALAGIAASGGPLLQASPPQLVSSPATVDPQGAEAFAFDLVAGSRPLTVLWVVEATLGSLLGGSIPVDEPVEEGPSVAPATLPDLGRSGTVPSQHDLSTLSDVATRVSVEVARGTVRVRDLTTMRPGTLFALDRSAGDVVDILVNGAMVARGDIVVVGRQLGVRITEVCEPVS
jgi:flagellar motor switch protein FliN/FliY